MRFSVLPLRGRPPTSARSEAFLVRDNWDDYSYKTLFALRYVDGDGARHDVGGVKIGQFGREATPFRIEVPETFDELPEDCFSLGQDDSYYENLNELGPEVRDAVLSALRDIAADQDLFQRARRERVTGHSLLRSVSVASVQGQFARLARGGARLSRYSFSYDTPPANRGGVRKVTLTFGVEPESEPPTNIHVLIGRNGVGKTRLLHLMSRALVEVDPSATTGQFNSDDEGTESPFANLVSVTFSAFDDFEPLPDSRNKATGLHYSYIGLKRAGTTSEGKPRAPKSPEQLSSEFVKSVRVCRQGARADRWRRALEMLEADPIFSDANIASIAESGEDTGTSDASSDFEEAAQTVFKRLSSGHKIVLLTITRLVETVEERSFVLLDEPEAHLHPPLLSAFVRSLSDLLVNRNGVAIIATHSPVVLQEVPKSCVWKIRRAGSIMNVDRPDVETFGENVGVLTREVFGLEVTQSGFHRMLQEAVVEERAYDDVVARFGSQLGGEALALIRAIIADRRSQRDGL